MANVVLSAQIEANMDNFVRNITAAASSSDRLGASVDRLTTDISRNIGAINRVNLGQFNQSLQAGQISLTRLATASANIRPALSNLTVGSNGAANALTNLGRVAQDAPFGFIGIQNNLNPLLESFQRLRTETGSNSAALRALGQSFIGPAGLGVALSLVTAAITFYTMWQQKSSKAAKEAKESTEDYADSLDDLTKAQLKGTQNAQKELVQLQSLYNLTQDVTASQKNRNDAVDELQAKYPEYFKNIKDETILAGGAADAYDRLSIAIIATAKADAARDIITKNVSKQLENEQKITDLRIAQTKAEKDAAAISKRSGSYNPYGGSTAGVGATLNLIVKTQQTQTEINKLQENSNELTRKNSELFKYVNSQYEKGADITKHTREETDKIAEIYRKLANDLKTNPLQLGADQFDIAEANVSSYQNAINSLVDNGYKPESAAIQDLINKQKELLKLRGNNLDISGKGIGAVGNNGFQEVTDLAPKKLGELNNVSLQKLRDEFGYTAEELGDLSVSFGTGLDGILKKTEDFNKAISDALNSGVISAFEGLGQSIGESLANGSNVLASVGKGLLTTFGGVLIDLGKIAIQTGIGIAAIKTALKTLNPVVAVAAGTALIALGSLISSRVSALGGGSESYDKVKQIPQFASGVQNFKGGLALVGERGPELVNLPTGANVNTNSRTRSIMGAGRNQPVVISSELGIEMGVLVAKIRTEEKRLNRLG